MKVRAADTYMIPKIYALYSEACFIFTKKL